MVDIWATSSLLLSSFLGIQIVGAFVFRIIKLSPHHCRLFVKGKGLIYLFIWFMDTCVNRTLSIRLCLYVLIKTEKLLIFFIKPCKFTTNARLETELFLTMSKGLLFCSILIWKTLDTWSLFEELRNSHLSPWHIIEVQSFWSFQT